MKQIILFFLVALFLYSCKPVLKNTYGRFAMNKMHNGGTVSAENYSEEIPFEIVDNQIILKVFADKSRKDTFNFLFDTHSYSGVSSKLYEKFKGDFANLRTDNAGTSKVPMETEIYLTEKLYIGDILIEDFNLTIDEYVNTNLDGIIGADFLEDKVFTFDFPNKKLLISDISPEENSKDYRFELTKNWRKIYSTLINIEDQEMKFAFDTGRTGFLHTTDKLKLQGNNQTSYELITRDRKGYRSGTFTIIQAKNLRLSNIQIDEALVIKSSDYKSNFLGNKILMKNKVILDCKNMQMILKLDDDKIKLDVKDFPTHSFALGWMERVKVVQKKVEINSIDLELFDEIIEINGMQLPDSQVKVSEFLEEIKNDRIWLLKVKRGDQRFDVEVPPSILIY